MSSWDRLTFLDRKHDIFIDEEKGAKDGENVIVLVKTALYEYLKSHINEELLKLTGVVVVEERMVRSGTDLDYGSATVEYHGSTKFTVKDQEHEIKLIFMLLGAV